MYYGDPEAMLRQCRDGLSRAIENLRPADLANSLGRLLAGSASTGPGKPGVKKATKPTDLKQPDQVLDLMVIVHPAELGEASLRSLIADAIASPTANSGSPADKTASDQLATALEEGVKAHPNDLSVAIAHALFALNSNDSARIAPALERLERLAKNSPLEVLPTGVKANARQRAEAARQVPLWLVARACWKQKDPAKHGAIADMLAAHAEEAAGRLTENQTLLAILREKGQMALERGDRCAPRRPGAGCSRWWSRRPSARSKSQARPRSLRPAPRQNPRPKPRRGTRRCSMSELGRALRSNGAARTRKAGILPLSPPLVKGGPGGVGRVTGERTTENNLGAVDWTASARPGPCVRPAVSRGRYGRTANLLTMRRFCGPPPLAPPSQGGERRAPRRACAQQKHYSGDRRSKLFNAELSTPLPTHPSQGGEMGRVSPLKHASSNQRAPAADRGTASPVSRFARPGSARMSRQIRLASFQPPAPAQTKSAQPTQKLRGGNTPCPTENQGRSGGETRRACASGRTCRSSHSSALNRRCRSPSWRPSTT